MHDADTLLKTPLDGLHRRLGGKMVPFAGYAMPVQYEGIIAEHTHTRAAAGLFDVSHMGQVLLTGEAVDLALEAVVPGDIQILKEGRLRYSVLLNEQGGIRDDLMITRRESDFYLVLNAAVKEQDISFLCNALPGVTLTRLEDHALLALQGPLAVDIVNRLGGETEAMAFMSARSMTLNAVECWVSRSGYTGEDGFEISVPVSAAETLAEAILAQPEAKPVGLGARDSLRLEAGLCLYGHDIDETTTPVEAGLSWIIGKRRKMEGGFAGADTVMKHLFDGAPRKRVGLKLDGRAPAREGCSIATPESAEVGLVTSGGFGPSLGGPIAMGYVPPVHGEDGTQLNIIIRGKPHPAEVVPMPFVPKGWK